MFYSPALPLHLKISYNRLFLCCQGGSSLTYILFIFYRSLLREYIEKSIELADQFLSIGTSAYMERGILTLIYGEHSMSLRLDSFKTLITLGVLGWLISANIANAFVVPPYGPSFWNTSSRQYYNNCYNYSTNVATNTFAQPGRAYFGYAPLNSSNMNCLAATWSAALDGTVGYTDFSSLQYLGASGTCDSGYTKLALVIDPGYDYHWYRRDSNNWWSHKRGGTAAKNVDESGYWISNPETADRVGYTDFCGYFCTASFGENINDVWVGKQNGGIAKIN